MQAPLAVSSSSSPRASPVAGAGADRAEQGVARRVPALDELDDVDAVALHPQGRRPQRVGERVGEPLAQDAVADQEGVRRRRATSCAATSWWQHGAASTSAASQRTAGQRVVGGGVAGVQREHDVGPHGERHVRDALHEGRLVGDPELRGDRGVVRRDCCLTSTPTTRTGSRALR